MAVKAIIDVVINAKDQRTPGQAMLFYTFYLVFGLVLAVGAGVVAAPLGVGASEILAGVMVDLVLPLLLVWILIHAKKLPGVFLIAYGLTVLLAEFLGVISALLIPAFMTMAEPHA
jgi:hypothetical protein